MRTLLGWAFACLALAAAPAWGQFPSKTLRLIISFPPGGVTDVLARQLAQKLAEGLGQPVIVDNRPGGNFIIAAEAAARAEPDGHTLFMAVDSTFTLNPLQTAKLPYDYRRDFAPLSLVGLQSLFIVASAKAPGHSLAELMAAAKASPGKVSFGSSALVAQLIGEQIKLAYGVDMLHVPFKGSPPMLQALLASDIDFAITTFTPYANYVKEGKLRGLAVTGTAREPAVAESPTLAEIGRGLGEHEASASRHLARTRRTLRDAVEQHLQAQAGLTQAEIADCLASAMADAGTLDLSALINAPPAPRRPTGRN